LLERLVFNNRFLVVLACLCATVFLAFQATRLEIGASFDRVIPRSHPYIKTYLDHRDELPGLGNNIRVVVENTSGDIFDPDFLRSLQQINDALYLIPGVDRGWMKSLWMPSVRYREVTEDGVVSPTVMPNRFDGSPAKLAELRTNIRKASLLGGLVANDYRSTMIVAPLLAADPATGKPLDYRAFSHTLEAKIRAQETAKVRIHIVGFGKLVGDLMDGIVQVMRYFLLAAAIAAVIIFYYNRCVRSTFAVLACSLVAVVWQLGLIRLLGYELDPYSVLVPFLVFAIGVSHGAQKMNGIMQDIGRGVDRYVAARYTFRRLFLAGLTALLADAVGFAVLMVIDIQVIKELALAASIGVGVLVITNLLLLPVLLSYTGVSSTAAERSLAAEKDGHRGIGRLWDLLDRFTERRWALCTVAVSAMLLVGGIAMSLQLKIGDLDPGASELRPDSRYNRDSAYITSHYGLSTDQFAVIVKVPPDGCRTFSTLTDMWRFEGTLRQVPGVQKVEGLASTVRNATSGAFEGSPKWLTISRDQSVLNVAITAAVQDRSLANMECSVSPVVAYLSDHKADTLNRVLHAVEAFAAEHNRADFQVLPAAGTAGIDAVTNNVVQSANRTMMIYVYAAVILLCLVTFRSWRAVIVAVVPLVITSFLCEALMVALGIGVKVSTLPVIALGVGIGVDYALYLLSVQLAQQRAGIPLAQAYRNAVQFTGKVVALVGVTLAVGVVCWAASPIKFQADMGVLLAFMFLWNMVGALILIPALSHFLLRSESQVQVASAPKSVVKQKART
jgi:predicted RND superfamily exporter protein